MNLKDICKLGAKKYFEEHGKYKNPYPNGTLEFNEFERGWMQSLKRNEGKLMAMPEKYMPYAGGNFPERVRDKPSEAEILAERYRARKG